MGFFLCYSTGTLTSATNTGDSMDIVANGANDTTILRMVDSSFTGCDNNGIEVTGTCDWQWRRRSAHDRLGHCGDGTAVMTGASQTARDNIIISTGAAVVLTPVVLTRNFRLGIATDSGQSGEHRQSQACLRLDRSVVEDMLTTTPLNFPITLEDKLAMVSNSNEPRLARSTWSASSTSR